MKHQVNLRLDQTTAIKCHDCGAETFNQTFLLRKISALLSPTGQESLMPIPVFECSQCGAVLQETLPKEMNETEEPKKSDSTLILPEGE